MRLSSCRHRDAINLKTGSEIPFMLWQKLNATLPYAWHPLTLALVHDTRPSILSHSVARGCPCLLEVVILEVLLFFL